MPKQSPTEPRLTPPAPKKRVRRYGPLSRIITAGAIGDMDGNSWEAKFVKANERKYVEQAGGDPDHALRRLIVRLVRLELHIELYEQKPLDRWTDKDGRVYGGLNSAFRLSLREFRALVRTAAAAKGPSLADHLAQRAAQREGSIA